MSKIAELFGHSTQTEQVWPVIVTAQQCPFRGRKCYKVRKSEPEISIGSCAVCYGPNDAAVIICPARLLERKQIFVDCLHLLTTHEPGNQLHIIPEVSIPGGSVDFFLVSARDGKVKDFVGIELQALDTTGTVWPERQRFLEEVGVLRNGDGTYDNRKFGVNWKMTAKTILVQMHHKVATFEHVNKKIVLVVQDNLLAYMNREFNFGHLHQPAAQGDSMHLHSYRLDKNSHQEYAMSLAARLSTDSEGIAICLGLQAEARVELQMIISALEAKLSPDNRFNPFG